MAIPIETLKQERDSLREQLRNVEAEQRRVESDLKKVRQQELRTKREIEALDTLIDLEEARAGEQAGAP